MGKRKRGGESKDGSRKRKRKSRIIYSSDSEEENRSNTDRDPGSSPQHVAHAGSPTRVRPSSTRDRAPTPVPTTSNAPDTAAKNADPVEDKEIDLDEDLLVLLGEAPEPETSFGKAVHKDISTRWLDILKKGLSKEVKEKLAKAYLIPSNCESLVPPILNPEAKAALTETFVKRDSSLLYRQKQTSVAISALAQAIDVIISCKDQELKQKILKPVNDACRILCDMHQAETKRRRKFVISSINTVMKETLTNSNTDKYLFGDNMSEKLKTAKNVQKSGEALKVPQKTAFHKSNFYKSSYSKNRTNFKPLHRQTAGRPDAGRTVPATRYLNNSNSASAPSRAPDRALPLESSPLLPQPRRTARR